VCGSKGPAVQAIEAKVTKAYVCENENGDNVERRRLLRVGGSS
jgi:hypothetical protein